MFILMIHTMAIYWPWAYLHVNLVVDSFVTSVVAVVVMPVASIVAVAMVV